VVLFNKYLSDIQLPDDQRQISGRHRGGKPYLGFEMDQQVFELLYERYLEPNEAAHASKRIKVDNVKINAAISEVLNKYTEDNSNYLSDKETLQLDFQYCKTGCHRFAKRHFFPDRFISKPLEQDLDDNRVFLCQSSYAIQKGYPVEGWTTPQKRF
jgi:hypothetical protein